MGHILVKYPSFLPSIPRINFKRTHKYFPKRSSNIFIKLLESLSYVNIEIFRVEHEAWNKQWNLILRIYSKIKTFSTPMTYGTECTPRSSDTCTRNPTRDPTSAKSHGGTRAVRASFRHRYYVWLIKTSLTLNRIWCRPAACRCSA